MNDWIEIKLTYEPGTVTLEKAVEVQRAVREYLQLVVEDADPEADGTFNLTDMKWTDDGKDEITIRVTFPNLTEESTP